MNISKAEQFVNEAINRFAEVIEIPFAIPVYVCARQEVDEERTKLMRSLGAEYEDFQDTTMGETINGVNGSAIVLYPFNIFNRDELNHILMHEMGHYAFRYENPEIDRKQIAGEYGKRKLSGFTLFDEFIAETVTFMVTGESFYRDNCQQELIRTFWNALPGSNPQMTPEAYYQREMYKAGIKVNTPELGYYIARIIADPMITSMIAENPTLDRGFKYCGKEQADVIEGIAVYLSDFMAKKDSLQDMLKITEDELDAIGKMVLKLIGLR